MQSRRIPGWAVWGVLGVILAAAAIWRFYLASLPPEILVARGYLDDGFFYLRVAQQIATGHGSTFDGIHMTNGYHPLWMGVLVVLYYLFPHFHGSFFTAHMAVQALLGILTCIILWRTLSLFTSNPWIRVIGTALYALNPRVIYMSLGGMETSLYLFLLSLVLYQFFTWVKNKQQPPRFYLLMGLSGALLFLTRTDAIVLLGVLLGVMWWLDRSLWGKNGLLLAAPTAVAGSLFAGVNWFFFHSLVQVNAVVPAFEEHRLLGIPLVPKTLSDLFWSIKHGLFFVKSDLIDRSIVLGMRAPLWAVIGMALVLFGLRSPEHGPKTFRQNLKMFAYPAAGFFLLFFLNSFLRFYNPEYYFAPWNYLAAILVGMVFEAVLQFELKYAKVLILVLTAWAGFCFFLTYRETYRPVVAAQNGMYATYLAVTWANEHLPEGARIGSLRRAGVASYWSKNPVENLDGKINNAVAAYKESGTLFDYMKDSKIEYFIEHAKKFDYLFAAFAQNSSAKAKLELLYLPDDKTLNGAPPIAVYHVTYQ